MPALPWSNQAGKLGVAKATTHWLRAAARYVPYRHGIREAVTSAAFAVRDLRDDLHGRIERKWASDCGALPLTPEHRELYDNIHIASWHTPRTFPDLVDCRDLNDHINWLKLFDQRREMIQCSDKVSVRDYVRKRVGDRYLVDLYQVHDRFSQIDFDALPDSFVIKANNDSGTVFPVNDRARVGFRAMAQRVERALTRAYGWHNGEWPYAYIRPKVLVEQFIGTSDGAAPSEYQFQCVDGRVVYCRYVLERGTDPQEAVTDRDGASLGFVFQMKNRQLDGFRRPPQWDELIHVAERLSEGFKSVRIDLRLSRSRVYAGEMTFFTRAGYMIEKGQKRVGHFFSFDRTSVRPLLIPELEKTTSRFDLYPELSKRQS